MSRIIQSTKSLPKDWLQQVKKFNIEQSSLSKNNKIIAKTLIQYILVEEEDALLNPLCEKLISHIVLSPNGLTSYYDDLPETLIQEGLNELKGQKGIQFTQKIHSVFIEFLMFIQLQKKGYAWKKFVREEGSCDFVMTKNGHVYHFEVKFKECDDTFISRLYDCINGMSLLTKYSCFRGNTYKIRINSYHINDKLRKDILTEIKAFITNKKDDYKGHHIEVFNTKTPLNNRCITQATLSLNDCVMRETLIDPNNIEASIKAIFMRKKGHIDKLKTKAKKDKFADKNFYGVLVWTIAFHDQINNDLIKKAFEKLALNFNLYVFISDHSKNNNYNFLLTSASTKSNSSTPRNTKLTTDKNTKPSLVNQVVAKYRLALHWVRQNCLK